MQRPNPETVTLSDILSTEGLSYALISNLPGGAAFVVDRDLRYLLAEGEALAIAGFKPEDFVGRTIFEVLPPDLAADYEPMYRQALAGEPFEHEHHAHNHWYISRGTPLRAENGEIYAVLSVSYDITDRKQAEAALRESEENFRAFVNASSDIVYKMSADWSVMQSLVGKQFIPNTVNPSRNWLATYIPEDEQPRVQAAIEEAIRTKRNFELEHRVIRADGTIGWTFSRAIPLLNEQGDIVEWLGAASDVTERKQTEAALRESEEKFRTLANTAPALIWYNDAQGENQFINQYFLDFTGKSAEQIRGDGWHELVHPDEAEAYIADYLVAVREQRPWHNRNRIRRHDGVWRWHDNYAQPLFNAHGVYLGHVGVTIDNTDAIEAEVALRESEARLAAELADAKQLQFISSQLIQEENIDALYEQILEAAIALMRSDMGSMQMLHPDNNELQLLIWKGFDPASAAFWQWVRVDSESSCGVALKTGERSIIPDVEACEFVAGSGDLDAFRRSRIRAVQTTPLVSRSGRVVGMISTQWQEPHQPSERELGLLDVLARQAADLIEQRQAEAALRESEQKYRTLFDSIDEGLAIVEMIYDDRGEIVDIIFRQVNRAYERHGGVYDVVGRSIFDIIPGVEDYWLDLYKRVAKTGESMREENYQQDVDRWFDVYFSRVDDNGRFVAIVFSDISERQAALRERKRNEERQAFLLKLSEILQQFVQPNDIKTAAMRLLGEHLGVSRAQYHECDSSGEYYSADGVGYANGLPLLDLKYRIDQFGTFVNEDFAAGRPYRIDDLEVSPRVSAEEREAYRSYQIRAGAGVPLIRGGKLVAILAVHDVHPHPWTDFEIELIRETAERIWTPFERARAQEALRESEAKYRSLFTSIDEGVNLLEMIPDESGHAVDFRIVETNPAWEQQTSLTDAVGKTLLEIAPDFEQQLLDFYSDVVISGRGRRTEYYTASVDRWYTVYASRIGGEESRQVAVVFNDITERKQREREQEFLLKLSDAIRPLGDAEAVWLTAARVLGRFLGACRVAYAEDGGDGETFVTTPNYVDGVPDVVGRYRYEDFGSGMEDELRAGRARVHSDVAADGRLSAAERQAFADMGIGASINVPLVKNGRLVAFMGVNYSAAHDFPPHEVELVREVAERIWATIERARAEAAMREAEFQRVREQSAREQERQRAEALAELDRAKTLFFSNVSHEFRTPLTLSLAPLQDALSDRTHPLDPVQRERLELVHRNSLRLLKLVNTLLDFSRIEAGRMEAVYEPTDLATYTAELSSVFRSAIERAGLQLMVDCSPLPEPVFVDRQMWEKIVLNLLSNAFKFTFEGEIRVSLHSTDRNQAILQIQDTGSGIAPEHLPHLFERFYQVRGTQARTHDGSGIGLALVHELVQLQGGTIEVSSTLGEGTCFTIALPFGTEHLPSDRLHFEGDRIQPTRTLTSTAMGAATYVEEAERWLPTQDNQDQTIENTEEPTTQTADSSLPTNTSACVLVVDDNTDMREYLTRILSEHVQVEAVADGVTALAVAQERVPDLILSDVMMPGLDGFELLQALRADPRTREIPIILLSARAGEEAIVEGLEVGADDYLIKPFSAQELVSRVTAHLQMAQQRGEALQQERIINRQKDEFISVVSHELNTPLVSILGWTRLLRSSPPNPVMLSKALDMIERNATLQGKLVQDLLDLSRITAGKLRLNAQPIELQPVIETAIATVTQIAIDKGIDLTWQETVTEPVVVIGDGDRLSQVLINLLTNAIKFTPESGSVNLELSVDTAYAQIRVADTGIGIASDFLPHVFDRFRQAEGTHSAKGLGLGLAIAHHIVELHNGTIHAESAGEGQGATFTVRLPLLQDGES